MTEQTGGIVQSEKGSAWKRDPTKDSPLRHETGGYLRWDDLAMMRRALDAYRWSLVIAGRSGADVDTEYLRVTRFGEWMDRLSHGEPGHECHAIFPCPTARTGRANG